MKQNTFFLLALLAFFIEVHAQEKDPEDYRYYLDKSEQYLNNNNNSDCITAALTARYNNEGHTTMPVQRLLINAYYNQGLYSMSKLALDDTKRLFGRYYSGSDDQNYMNNMRSLLDSKGYGGDVSYPGTRYELVSNRDAWLVYMDKSQDDEWGSYKNCPSCSGPRHDTYYYNRLYLFGNFAYELFVIKSNASLDDQIYFLKNFPDWEYFTDAKHLVCKRLNALVDEHQKAGDNYSRLARQEKAKGILWSAIGVPAGLIATIAGASNLNKSAGNAVLLGLGMAGTIFGVTFAASHFSDAEDYEASANKEYAIANQYRAAYNCGSRWPD